MQQQIFDRIKIKTISIPLSKEQMNALNSIYDLYKQDNNIKQENIRKYIKRSERRMK